MRRLITEPVVTPIVDFSTGILEVRAKLERHHRSGSHKERPARFIIETLQRTGGLPDGATLLVSSSGNFGRAIAHNTTDLNVTVHIVTDRLSSPGQIASLSGYPHVQTTVIDCPDTTGSHLTARLHFIDEELKRNPRAIVIDQYANFLLPLSYEGSLVKEIEEQAHGSINAIFVVVGTGATLNGILQFRNLHGARWKVIAVDAEGSALFHVPPFGTKRRLPGYGNGRRCELVNLLPAGLDAVVHVSDPEVVAACRFLARNGISAGPSSGAAVVGVDWVAQFRPDLLKAPGRPLLIMPDGSEHYADTVYNANWLQSKGIELLSDWRRG